MKKIAVAGAILLTTLTSTVAGAKEHLASGGNKNWFASVKLGMMSPDRLGGNTGLGSPDRAATGTFALGYQLHENFSAELEYLNVRKSKIRETLAANDGGDKHNWAVRSNALMLNGNAYLLKDGPIKPFVSAGVGFARNTSDNYNITASGPSPFPTVRKGRSTSAVAWSAGAGFVFKTFDRVDTTFEYRYIDLGAVKTKGESYTSYGPVSNQAKKASFKGSMIMIGARMKF